MCRCDATRADEKISQHIKNGDAPVKLGGRRWLS